jgi:hypothetical protein
MKVKISGLSGVQLDYAVDLVEGGYADYLKRHAYAETKNSEYIEREPREPLTFRDLYGTPTCPRYSTDWAIAGPISERENISIEYLDRVYFRARKWCPDIRAYTLYHYSSHASPLVAVMRCYVASKLGDAVEIPEGLK